MITDKEFEQLEFNPKAIKSEKQLNGRISTPTMLEFYPKLQKIKSFMGYTVSDRDHMIKYIVYMYSPPPNPLLDNYREIDKRKEAAWKLAGFDGKQPTRNKFKQMVSCNYGKLTTELNMIVDYLAFMNNAIWTNLIANEQAHRNIIKLIMQNPGDVNTAGKYNSLMEDCDKIADRIKGYYSQLFNKDEKEAEIAMQRERISFVPEDVAVDVEEDIDEDV